MNNSFFDKIIHTVVYRGKVIEKIFIVAVVVCTLMAPFVGVNYDLSKYLPESAPTKQALDVMEREFGYPGMARVMMENVSLYEARGIRQQIADVEGVDMVVGVDSLNDVNMSDSFIDESSDLVDMFYKDNCAVMEIVFKGGNSDKGTSKALDQIYEICGDRGRYSGPAVSTKNKEESVVREIAIAMVFAVIIILLILTLTTTSWLEPLLFVFIMGVAIIINVGSNIIFGTISFFTFSTAAILQLAVSMDYSIFLLHTFYAKKKEIADKKEAMAAALKEASSSIFASGATTIVGFLAIALMKFTVGKDMGFVLTKGIIVSLATVMLLMPAMILRYDDRIQKFSHKRFIPEFNRFAKGIYGVRHIVLVVSLIIAIPCFVGQNMNDFLFGDEALGVGPGTQIYEDMQAINDKFGKSNVLIAMVPNGSPVKERDLTDELDDLDYTNYALSLAGVLPEGIPEDFLPGSIVKELRTDQYARMLISMKNSEETEYSFECSQAIDEIIKKYYPEDSYLIGMTPTTIDIRDILTTDYNNVSILSMIGVALVVAITFGSIIMPVLVIIPIEVAIYLNMTLPFILGEQLLYIGYIIVSCLQLGATIDYSILMTNNYLSARSQMGKQESAIEAINRSAISVLTSGGILMVVGYGLFFTSSLRAISQIGRLVGRGAIFSVILVLSLLPALLVLCDKAILRQQAGSAKRKAKRAARREAHLQKLKDRHAARIGKNNTDAAQEQEAELPPAEPDAKPPEETEKPEVTAMTEQTETTAVETETETQNDQLAGVAGKEDTEQ